MGEKPIGISEIDCNMLNKKYIRNGTSITVAQHYIQHCEGADHNLLNRGTDQHV